MPKKILIIEDEDILLDILTKNIMDSGFEAITAKDGEEGLEKIKKHNPDLILLDIVLPKISGYDVLNDLKNRDINIPVIIISNSGQPVDIEKAMALGARDHVVKTEIDPDKIIEKIKKQLGMINNRDKNSEDIKKDKNKKFVLLAEDDMFLRELCSKKLIKKGYTVEEASNGEEAYKKIINLKPDIVLLDIIMPGMEGYEILKKIKSSNDKEISDIPVIILSNLGQEDDVRKGINLGASDYLIKANYTMDEIINKVEKNLK